MYSITCHTNWHIYDSFNLHLIFMIVPVQFDNASFGLKQSYCNCLCWDLCSVEFGIYLIMEILIWGMGNCLFVLASLVAVSVNSLTCTSPYTPPGDHTHTLCLHVQEKPTHTWERSRQLIWYLPVTFHVFYLSTYFSIFLQKNL